MTSPRRLIEAAFPLRQVSLDSVHEKNVRHGHISTLHIWPARRPLAACRAALLATLLPDPGTPEKRQRLLERMAGRIVEVPDAGSGRTRKATQDGVLHWGRESAPAGRDELAKFRKEIRDAFGGRAPRVLDPFAGGGAIPLEAMRLGCEAAASDINPVAWFLLRCTLHYPQRFAGQERPLPAFALRERAFAQAYLKARDVSGGLRLREELTQLGHGDGEPVQTGSPHLGAKPTGARAELPWHLRAWGRWLLERVRGQLATRYPAYAEFEPMRRKGRGRTTAPAPRRYRRRPPRLLTPGADGRVSAAALNAEFDSLYLENEANPRWVAKPPVAYLWARTVRCGNCRSSIPLLKTRWLCKKGARRVLLVMEMRKDGEGVAFRVERDVPEGQGNAARKRERDKIRGAGTMSRSGATCPGCGAIATMKDLRVEGCAGRLGEILAAVVVDGQEGKEYRLPRPEERAAAEAKEDELRELYAEIPFGLPEEPVPRAGAGAARAFSVDGYGFGAWRNLFTNRQLLVLGSFVRAIRQLPGEMEREGYPKEWREAVTAYLSCVLNKLSDYSSAICSWHNSRETLGHTFVRFALPMVWDYCEVNPLSGSTGGFDAMLEWVARCAEHTLDAVRDAESPPQVLCASAAGPNFEPGSFDLVLTDPPYYDAIPYSDLMDFFHVWLRRALYGLSPELDAAFAEPLGPKWDAENNDGELIDDASRFGGDRQASKANYEDGMARTFRCLHEALRDDGRLAIVFANKRPDAWETLVSALIRAGFAVDGSWPIATEMGNRQRAMNSAALSSSIWLVCKKRPAAARPGWDGQVLQEMRDNIRLRLREFWDANIRGPDFVWAATGPALEAFSRHPAVKKADTPGQRLTVGEFLRRVRRMVVAFVVSRLLARDGGAEGELDDVTTYYLLHRSDFRLGPAPAGVCILYALSCNLSDADLAGRGDLLLRGGRAAPAASADDEGAADEAGASGSELRLKPWNRRAARDLGEPAPDGSPPPLIDCVHRLMRLWKTGEQSRVDAYLEARGLWRHELYARLVQALIELAERDSEERSILESIQNHLKARGGAPIPRQQALL